MNNGLKLLLVGLFLVVVPKVNAQVATPPIDPAEPTLISAASSWRFGGSMALGTDYGYQETQATKTDAKVTGPSALLVFSGKEVIWEFYNKSSDTAYEWDSTSDQLYQYTRSNQQLNLSVRGEGRVSVGLGAIARSDDSRGIQRKQSGFAGSFGVRIGDGFFLGAGMNRVTEKVADFEDKQWNEYMGGAGFAYGSPEKNMFRLEVSGTSEPEVSGGTSLEQVHHKRTRAIEEMEVLWHNYLVTVRAVQSKSFAALDGESDRQENQMRYGLGLRSLGFSWILYRTLADERVGDNWYKERYYKMTLGFGFL
ncbi:MAG: hypothetical protein RRB13_04525 [bacterium]|nr:hypothetical protein [bacterium]